eukprot:12790859-Heterocapsa_arctica.AAC.1
MEFFNAGRSIPAEVVGGPALLAKTKQYLMRAIITEFFMRYIAADVMHTLNILVAVGDNDKKDGGVNVSTDRLNWCKRIGISKSRHYEDGGAEARGHIARSHDRRMLASRLRAGGKSRPGGPPAKRPDGQP